MPTPQEAAAILKAGMDSGFDPVKLALLRKQRADELTRNRELEQSSNNDALRSRVESRFQSPSERTRNEMMGWDLGPTTMRSGATASDVSSLEDDIKNDPFTGDAEQARIGRIRNASDASNTTMRDDVGQADKTMATRNAFAEFMKNREGSRGKFAADVSPEGEQSLDEASKRRASELGVRWQSQGGKNAGPPVTALRPGDDPLSGLSPQQAAVVKGLTEYSVPATGSQLRTPQWQDLVGRAMLLDPTFEPNLYESRQKLRADYTSGKSGQNVQALATVQDHLDALRKKADALNNGSFQPLNAFGNWINKQTGDKAIQGYEFDRNAVSDELSAALKSTGATDAEIRGWSERLNSSQSPDQFRETFRSAADLVEKRLHESRTRYETGMGKPGAFDEFMKRTEHRAGNTASGGDQPPQAPAGWMYVPKPGGGWTAVEVR